MPTDPQPDRGKGVPGNVPAGKGPPDNTPGKGPPEQVPPQQGRRIPPHTSSALQQ
jgi:hypothetical protein